jgi:hypothetical protein
MAWCFIKHRDNCTFTFTINQRQIFTWVSYWVKLAGFCITSRTWPSPNNKLPKLQLVSNRFSLVLISSGDHVWRNVFRNKHLGMIILTVNNLMIPDHRRSALPTPVFTERLFPYVSRPQREGLNPSSSNTWRWKKFFLFFGAISTNSMYLSVPWLIHNHQ